MSAPAPLVRMERITKRFGRTTVLDGVSLDLHAGEVHALLGENGAGKSTLLKILAGIHTDQEGALLFEGRPVRLRSPMDASALGITVIHQELSLLPALTVAENLFVDRPLGAFGLIDRRKERARAIALLDDVGLRVSPDEPVERLSLSERQLVEIARALGRGARVLVLDEPTSALTGPAIDRLFEILRGMKARGVAIVYVSHRMEEIERITDRVTVLRDGRVAGRARTAETSLDEIVAWMLGRAPGPEAKTPAVEPSHDVLLSIEDFSVDALGGARPLVDRVSLSLRAGEIVGLFGLSDAGASELLLGLFGALGARAHARDIKLSSAPVQIRSPREAMSLGVGFVPADRGAMGLVHPMSAEQNGTLVVLPALSPWGLRRPSREHEEALRMARDTALGPQVLAREAGSLSGGNQQKVVLGKWLLARPRVLLCDEPTRGVDVSAKAEIHQRLRSLASTGAAVLFASSDVREVASLADRILVLRRGRIAAELMRGDASPDKLLGLAMGQGEVEA